MEQPFFSIIIPIYKVENYLNECVDSVLSQTFKDIEVILVDDGSPDNCPTICDEYVQKDARVITIHKANGGVSDARNVGVKAAHGKYLLFLDSDDYWDDADALSKLQKTLVVNDVLPDVAVFQAKLLYPDGSLLVDQGYFESNLYEMNSEQALHYMTKRGLLIGSACSKAIKRNFFVENELYFTVGIRHEDIDWVIRMADCLPKYIYSNQFFYIYRKGREEAFTTNVTADHLETFLNMLVAYAEDFHFSTEVTRNCLLSLVAYEFSILMAKTALLRDKSQRRKLSARIKAMQSILKYDKHPKIRVINKVKKLLGFDLTMALLGVYLKYRKR